MAERAPKDTFKFVDGTLLTPSRVQYNVVTDQYTVTAATGVTDEERAHAAIQREFDPEYKIRLGEFLANMQAELERAFRLGEDLHQQEKGVSATLIRELATRG